MSDAALHAKPNGKPSRPGTQRRLRPPARAREAILFLVEYLPKPSGIPMTYDWNWAPRFLRSGEDRWRSLWGLLEKAPARVPYPQTIHDAYDLDIRSVGAFNRWWNGLTLEEAQRAINLLWK